MLNNLQAFRLLFLMLSDLTIFLMSLRTDFISVYATSSCEDVNPTTIVKQPTLLYVGICYKNYPLVQCTKVHYRVYIH